MDHTGQIAQTLQEMMKPLVAAIIKEIQPQRDELSTNNAHRFYGRRWIEQNRDRGNLHPIIKGNKVVYSRAEIEALLTAEKPNVSLQ